MRDCDLTEHRLPPLLESFLAYWASWMVDGMPPIRGENFSPAAMRKWLGHLALIEKDTMGGFRFRLAGTYLLGRFGSELTNKRFDDIDSQILGDLEDRVRRSMDIVTPVIKIVPTPIGRRDYFDLLLPLANTEGAIDLVVLASTPATLETSVR